MSAVTERSIPAGAAGTTIASVAMAQTAIDLAPSEPDRARTLLAALDGEQCGDEVASMVERARGLIAMADDHSDAMTAERHLKEAIARADRAGLGHRAGQARMSLAFLQFVSGDTRAALHTTTIAEPALRGVDRGRLLAQRALILSRIGRYSEALGDYAAALPVLEETADILWEARLRMNRGWVHAYLGRWAEAEADLARAEELNLALGNTVAAAEACHNRGFVASLRGDMPGALALFDQAAATFDATARRQADYLLDAADVYLSLGLVDEGHDAASRAVQEATRRRMSAEVAEARLRLAQAQLLAGDFDAAGSTAGLAARAFDGQRRPAWAALARSLAVHTDWAAGRHDESALRRARRATAALAASGWTVAALDARLTAARVALALGRTRLARQELATAARARKSGPAALRVKAWHAEALLRLADGNRRGAKTALRAGLRVMEEFRATLGATELRAHVSSHGEELAQLGLRLVLEERQARRVLSWAEHWRSGALARRPVQPPDDARLARQLADLRRTVTAVGDAALRGGDTASLLRRQAVLEQRIRRRARQARGDTTVGRTVAVSSLGEMLGERALVEYVGLDGQLHAVVLAGGRTSLHALGRRDDVERELTALRFALRRLSLGRGSTPSLEAAAQAVTFSAAVLDAALLAPLRNRVGDRDVVLVPTGALHAMPWSVLPFLAGRPATVAPSAAIWARAAAAGDSPSEVSVFVAGPDLEHAGREIAALARRYPKAVRFSGRRARVATVLHALDGARVAHIAAHGHFRADNPMFANLALADGPLTVYDFERMGRAPDVVVLSACDAGLSDVRPGDELMGLAAALFSLGTRTLVASVVPVPDAATRRLMLAFHRGLRAGSAPSAALAQAQVDADPAAGFVCFGAG